MVRVRRLEAPDWDEWVRMRLALWPHHTVAEMAEEAAIIVADAEQPVVVAVRDDGSLCGLLEAAIHTEAPGCTTNRIGYLEGWWVDPDMRRQGVGRLLVAAAEA